MKSSFISRMSDVYSDNRGAAAVEFAITFPILAFITLAIFDIGRGIFYYTSVNNVAAETVRYASVRGLDSPTSVNEDEVMAFARARATGMDQEDLTVTVEYDPDAGSGSNVTVTVDYDFKFYLAGWFDNAKITLTGVSAMEVL